MPAAVKRLKYLASPQNRKLAYAETDRAYIGLENIESWTGRLVAGENAEPDGTVSLYEAGDVLFGKLRPYLAKVHLAEHAGACSTEALVLRTQSEIVATYLKYVLLDPKRIDEINASTFGAQMPRASWDFIGNCKLAVPDLDTQKAIAAFLDRETARVDQLIAKKERQVTLLLEKEASLLDGLSFQSPWSASSTSIPFKWICRIPNGQVDPTESEWADFPLIAPNHIEQGTGRLLYVETAREQGADSGKYAFPAGTVVYSKIRPNLAKACIVLEEGLCSADMYPIIPDRRLLPQFLLMQLLSRTFTAWATTESMRVAMPKINRETLGSFRLLVPSIEQQNSSVNQWHTLRQETEASRAAISKTIVLLREKRAALITAAVTGQIDVRAKIATCTTKTDRSKFRLIVGAEIIHRHQNNRKFGRVKLQKELYLAEAHVGVGELQGNYLREAAGPLDRALIEETERALETNGYYRARQLDGTGGAVTYTPLSKAGQHATVLKPLLGPRADALRSLITLLNDLDRRQVEAITTLYAVWNDSLIDGQQPDDATIIASVLTEWHAEKGEKFKEADLRHWLAWMKRNGLTPRGEGPRTAHTMTRNLFQCAQPPKSSPERL